MSIGLGKYFQSLTESLQRDVLKPIADRYDNDGKTKLAKNGFFANFANFTEEQLNDMFKPVADRINTDGMRKPVFAKHGFWAGLEPIQERWNDDGMVKLAKNGKMNTLEKPKEHKMIKHSSPLAQNEHGLFQHNLYSTVQHIGFGIKSYV